MPRNVSPDWYLPSLVQHHVVRSTRWRNRRRQALLPSEPPFSIFLGFLSMALCGWTLWATCQALRVGPVEPWTHWVSIIQEETAAVIAWKQLRIATPTLLTITLTIAGFLLGLIGLLLTRREGGRPLWTIFGIVLGLLSLGMGPIRELAYRLLYGIPT